MHGTVADKAARLRPHSRSSRPYSPLHDPTGTHRLRAAFRADMDRRWDKAKRQVRASIAAQDPLLHIVLEDRVRGFNSWLDELLSSVVLERTGAWMAKYLDTAFRMARDRAHKIVVTADALTIDQANDAKELAIASLAVTELQGIDDAVAQQATRCYLDLGLTNQQKTARAIVALLDSVGRARSRMLVNAIIVKAFSSATLDAFRRAGTRTVGTVPERQPRSKLAARDAAVRDQGNDETVDVLTAGDDDVCQECEDISEDGPYSIDDAEALIPAHPNCRCAFVPADDDRFASVHDFNPFHDPHSGQFTSAGGPTKEGIVAYHGSPQTFSEFKASHMSEGEGHQAYGHGLYFAEEPLVAREYQHVHQPEDLGAEYAPDASKIYKVNIAAHPDEFLDLEKPFGEQSPKVQAALTRVAGKGEDLAQWSSGQGIYNALLAKQDYPTGHVEDRAKLLAERLRGAGIAGNRYLDRLSRQTGFTTYPATSNYVVFDPKKVKILAMRDASPNVTRVTSRSEASDGAPGTANARAADGHNQDDAFQPSLRTPRTAAAVGGRDADRPPPLTGSYPSGAGQHSTDATSAIDAYSRHDTSGTSGGYGSAQPHSASKHAAGILFVTSSAQGLFTRRTDAGKYWSIPAGHVEPGEEPVEAAQREAVEEVGHPGDHRIRPLDRRSYGNLTFHTFVQPLQQRFDPILNGEHDMHRWASLDNPPEPLHPGLRKTLGMLRSMARRSLKDDWAVINGEGGQHVIPTGEVHEDTPNCRCGPTHREGVWVHHSLTRDYDPDEPRDEHGKWTSGGGSAEGSPADVIARNWESPPEFKAAAREKMDEVARKLDFDTDSMHYVDTLADFMLNGKEYNTAGSVARHSDQVSINMNAPFATLADMPGIAAHEIEHAKFNSFLDSDKTGLVANLAEELIKADGVTNYSVENWRAWAKGEKDLVGAIHETLAEMAKIKLETGKLPEAKDYYGFRSLDWRMKNASTFGFTPPENPLDIPPISEAQRDRGAQHWQFLYQRVDQAWTRRRDEEGRYKSIL